MEPLFILLTFGMGGGRNVDDQNVDRPKISERRNGLFSWSERRNQNVENVFWVDQNVENEWSLLRKSERRKEWKERRKSHFCLIFTF